MLSTNMQVTVYSWAVVFYTYSSQIVITMQQSQKTIMTDHKFCYHQVSMYSYDETKLVGYDQTTFNIWPKPDNPFMLPALLQSLMGRL